MKFLLFIFFLCAVFRCSAQSNGNSLSIKPRFQIGDTKTYYVREETKTDAFAGGPKAVNEYRIRYRVLDTINGFTLSYSIQTVKATNRNLNIESFIAAIVDKTEFIYYLKADGSRASLANANEVRSRFITVLDSLADTKNFSRKDGVLLHFLKETLSRPRGMEVCLASFMIFNNCFNQPLFNNHKEWKAATTYDLFYEPVFPGVVITELKEWDKGKNAATVELNFKGNKAAAARNSAPVFLELYAALKGKTFNTANLPHEMRFDSERTIEVDISTGWPTKIHDRRIEFYVNKIIKKMTMELVEE